jgi:non-heme chloroperoxidase
MNQHTVEGGGGVKLNVIETGGIGRKCILFVHGFSQCSLAWNRQMDSSLASDFRLVALDNRGHGLSEKTPDVYGDSKLWADDLHSVITSLEIEKPVLCAWSYGGVIISDYIRHYGEDKIAGTNWVAGVSRLGAPLAEGKFLGDDFLEISQDLSSVDTEKAVSSLARFIRLCFFDQPAMIDFYQFLGCNLIVPPYVRDSLLARNVDNDDVVKQMSKPMLLSHGDKDQIVKMSMSDHIVGLASHALLSSYAGVGHAPFWERTERFNQELREFRELV